MIAGPASLVLPSGLAIGISNKHILRAAGQDLPSWGLPPGHTVLNLEGYLLQDAFHKPQIFIFPAQRYAELLRGAFESMHRLRNVMDDQGNPFNAEPMPAIPFLNTAQNFASNFPAI